MTAKTKVGTSKANNVHRGQGDGCKWIVIHAFRCAENASQTCPLTPACCPAGAPRDAGGIVAGASSDEDVQAVNAQPARVVDGPSTNPEPPPEGLLPLVPHRSMDAGADEEALAGGGRQAAHARAN